MELFLGTETVWRGGHVQSNIRRILRFAGQTVDATWDFSSHPCRLEPIPATIVSNVKKHDFRQNRTFEEVNHRFSRVFCSKLQGNTGFLSHAVLNNWA